MHVSHTRQGRQLLLQTALSGKTNKAECPHSFHSRVLKIKATFYLYTKERKLDRQNNKHNNKHGIFQNTFWLYVHMCVYTHILTYILQSVYSMLIVTQSAYKYCDVILCIMC